MNEIFYVVEIVFGGGNCLVFMFIDFLFEGSGGVYWNNDLSFGASSFFVVVGYKFV